MIYTISTVLNNIKNSLNQTRLRRLTDMRNLGLYAFLLLVLAISWSAVKTVQRNYELQKEISTLKQQNDVLSLYNDNVALENKYLETDEYLELAARQNLGLAAPGEKVLLIPSSVSQKYIDKSLLPKQAEDSSTEEDSEKGNWQNLIDWRDFILGRDLSGD